MTLSNLSPGGQQRIISLVTAVLAKCSPEAPWITFQFVYISHLLTGWAEKTTKPNRKHQTQSSSMASPVRGGWGRARTGEANHFLFCDWACLLGMCQYRESFPENWGWGWSGWGESASCGLRWRCASCFYGLARGAQKKYTQTPGASLTSWIHPSWSDMGQGLNEKEYQPDCCWARKAAFCQVFHFQGQW